MLLVDENGLRYDINEEMKYGAGGQGVVYKVTNNDKIAIKVKVPIDASSVRDAGSNGAVLSDDKYESYARKIRYVQSLNAVHEIDHIATPIALLQKPYCGYVMRFMGRMVSIGQHMGKTQENLLSERGKNNSLAKKLKVLAKLAAILCDLRAHGLVYCDISPGNVFVSRESNSDEVWLIDLDNLRYSGVSGCAIGTPRYRAPEIASGEHTNTFYSDAYSFALLAYEYLVMASPFFGAMSSQAETEDLWDEAEPDAAADDFSALSEKGEIPYVYEGEQNARIEQSGIPLDYVMTDTLKDLFLRTFNETGRKNPVSRPSVKEWKDAFEDAYYRVSTCSNGHDHLGVKCLWCDREKEQDTNRYFSLTVEDVCADNGLDEEEWDISDAKPIKPYEKRVKHFSQKKRMSDRKTISVPVEFFGETDGVATLLLTNSSVNLDMRFMGKSSVYPREIMWEYKNVPAGKKVMLRKNGQPYKIVSIYEESTT